MLMLNNICVLDDLNFIITLDFLLKDELVFDKWAKGFVALAAN